MNKEEELFGVSSPSDHPERFFVMGCSRSGTTLMQTFFSAHPDIYAFPETSFFENLIGQPLQRRFGKYFAEEEKSIKRLLASIRVKLGFPSLRNRSGIVEMLERLEVPHEQKRFSKATLMSMKASTAEYLKILDSICLKNHSKIWCEKTPNHVHYLPEISKIVPDARFVHVVRNGCDVAASLRDAAIKYPNTVWPRFYSTAERAARRWVKCIQDAGAYAGQENHIVVTYEGLAESPTKELVRLCDFLNLPFSESMLSERESQMDQVTRNRGEWRLGVQQNVSAQRGNKFNSVFDIEEQKIVKHICDQVDLKELVEADLVRHPYPDD